MGCFKNRFILVWVVRNYSEVHSRKNQTLSIRKIVIIYQQKTFLHFLTLLSLTNPDYFQQQ